MSFEPLLRSIRRWLLAAVFLLGVGLIGLADAGYAVAGDTDGPVFAAVGIVGGVVALAAGLALVGSLGQDPPTA